MEKRGPTSGEPVAGDGGPDVRGWEVRTRLDGSLLGQVEDVLLDEDGLPRYLEVHLAADRRSVLLPCGHAVPDPDEEVVWVPGLGRGAFRDIPDPPGEEGADSDWESRLAEALDRAYPAERFYESPHYRATWTTGRTGRLEERVPADAPARVDTLPDLDIAGHEHDPRGWIVVGGDGARLGTVDDLLGDPVGMRVRYLTLRPDRDIVEDGRCVLVPVGHAVLEPDLGQVRVQALSRERLASFPAWGGGPPERRHERVVTRALSAGYQGPERYRHPRFRWSRPHGGRGPVG